MNGEVGALRLPEGRERAAAVGLVVVACVSPQIGAALGGRNHSTVLHGYQKIAGEIGADETLRQELHRIREQLYQLPN